MKKFVKRSTLPALMLMLVLIGSQVAFADNTYVAGDLNKSGSLVQYDYVRTHGYYGPISLSVDDMPTGYLRLGLRNMKVSGGPQFTDSKQWNTTGAKEWSDILEGTRFAFQGRMQQTSSWFADIHWGGDLTY